MSSTFETFKCSGCGKASLLNLGDLSDITAPDVESAKCCHCGKVTVLIDDEMSMVMYGQVRTADELAYSAELTTPYPNRGTP